MSSGSLHKLRNEAPFKSVVNDTEPIHIRAAEADHKATKGAFDKDGIGSRGL